MALESEGSCKLSRCHILHIPELQIIAHHILSKLRRLPTMSGRGAKWRIRNSAALQQRRHQTFHMMVQMNVEL